MTANILIVEDEPAIQELLAFNVNQCGFKAIQALDVMSASRHINHALPDMVLLDWMLPDTAALSLPADCVPISVHAIFPSSC